MDEIQFRIDTIAEINPDALFLDGFEEAIIGYVQLTPHDYHVAMYAAEIVLDILHDHHGMSYPEATEWYEFNMLGSYMGPHTPVFVPVNMFDEEEEADFYVERADGNYVPYNMYLFDEEED